MTVSFSNRAFLREFPPPPQIEMTNAEAKKKYDSFKLLIDETNIRTTILWDMI
jgi:hypothetical protein